MDGERTRDRTAVAWLGAILVGGAVLRTVAIGQQALWADEALTYVIAKVPAWALAIRPIDPTAPLYYWLHALLIPDGASAAIARSISAVAGIVTIALTYFAGRRIDGARAGLVAAALVAVSGALVDYAQEARAYALLVMLVMASAVMMLRILQAKEPPRLIDLGGFALLSLLAMMTHFVALFWVASALAVLRLTAGRAGSPLGPRHVYGVAAAVAVGIIPEAIRVYRYASGPNAFRWLDQASPSEAVTLVAGQWLPFAAQGTLIAGLAALLWLAVVLGAARRFPAWARSHPGEAGVIAALMVQPLLLWLFGFLSSPIFMPRTTLIGIPGFALLVAVAVQSIKGKAAAIVSAGLVATAVGSTLIAGTVRAKEDWHGAASFAKVHRPDTYILCPQWKAPAIMAAIGPTEAAILTISGDGFILLKSAGEQGATWDRAYYDHYYRPVIGSWFDAPQARIGRGLVKAGTVAVLASECSPDERKAIAGWIGTSSGNARWSSHDRSKLLDVDAAVVRAADGRRAMVTVYQ